MRIVLATITMLVAAGQASAMCFSGGVQSDAVDAIKYLACVVDEQNSKIDELTSKIERLEMSINDLESKVDSFPR